MSSGSLLKPIATTTPDQASDGIATALLKWFEEEGKTYPWRETTDPYAILVSEIMLQQTQIAAVLGKGFYVRWMERFPDTKTLAEATEEEVLKQWEGLGYYSRARNLQKMAQMVETKHGGVFPTTHEALLKLPSVGPYTAGAVMSFAFNEPYPIVDGNVARVLSRLYNDDTPIDSTAGQKTLWKRSQQLVDAQPVQQAARPFNSALMELGQRICKKANPSCWDCPVSFACLATSPETLPTKKAKTKSIAQDEWIDLYTRHKGDLLEVFITPIEGRRRKGLWGFPQAIQPSSLTDQKADYQAKYAITKYKVTLYGVFKEPPLDLPKEGKWLTLAQTEDYPLAAPYRKVIDWLKTQ